MRRASHGVLAKHVWPGTVHSSSLAEGHHWRCSQVSVWMSAKSVPQKKKYLTSGWGWADIVGAVAVARRRVIN